MTVLQGDSYDIAIDIQKDGAVVRDPDEIEVMIGSLRKTLTAGEVVYDVIDKVYLVHLTQEETFRLSSSVPVVVRVLFAGGEVIGATAGTLMVDKSRSRVVLT